MPSYTKTTANKSFDKDENLFILNNLSPTSADFLPFATVVAPHYP